MRSFQLHWWHSNIRKLVIPSKFAISDNRNGSGTTSSFNPTETETRISFGDSKSQGIAQSTTKYPRSRNLPSHIHFSPGAILVSMDKTATCFAIVSTNTSVMSLKLVDPGPSARTQVEKTSGEAVRDESNKSNQLHHQIDNEMANVVSESGDYWSDNHKITYTRDTQSLMSLIRRRSVCKPVDSRRSTHLRHAWRSATAIQSQQS